MTFDCKQFGSKATGQTRGGAEYRRLVSWCLL
nr:MAG TPA: hypothetical protein [Caudoviricetes sp.]